MRLVAEEGGFDYVADAYDDDLPHWLRFGEQDQLVVPYTLDANDMRFATPQGFNSGDQFEAYLRDCFDVLYAEGRVGSAKMMSIGLHCRLAGRPGRAAALRRFIDYARGFEGVWFATRAQIAAHWAKTHPPQHRERAATWTARHSSPSLAAFSNIRPGLPSAPFDGELGPAHDTDHAFGTRWRGSFGRPAPTNGWGF